MTTFDNKQKYPDMVVFTRRPGSLFSWLTARLMGTEYSHVLYLDHETWQTYESRLGGCRSQPGFNPRDAIVHVHLVKDSRNQVAQRHSLSRLVRADSKLGTAYDVPALLWFLLVLLSARLGLNIPRLHINPRWMLCSEYVWYILSGKNETLTPAELHAKLQD